MFLIQCPHCQSLVEIEQVNCAIFRHGTFKTSGEQIPPHAPKSICDEWVDKKLIYGCGKPFRLIKTNNGYDVETCQYI